MIDSTLLSPLANTVALVAIGFLMGVTGGMYNAAREAAKEEVLSQLPDRLPGERWVSYRRRHKGSRLDDGTFGIVWSRARIATSVYFGLYAALILGIVLGPLRLDWAPLLLGFLVGVGSAMVVRELGRRSVRSATTHESAAPS